MAMESDDFNKFITKSRLKVEFGLTDSLIQQLGAPDELRPNPRYRSAPPMQLYLRQRVEAWVAEHQDLVTGAQGRRQSAQKAVETKRTLARAEIAKLVKNLRMKPVPERSTLMKQVSRFLSEQYWDWDGEVTEKALCSFIRHNYTNYEEILELVKGKVGASELYENVKLYLCCRIIKRYGLEVDPVYAAFGEATIYRNVPERFVTKDDLETVVAQLIGLDQA